MRVVLFLLAIAIIVMGISGQLPSARNEAQSEVIRLQNEQRISEQKEALDQQARINDILEKERAAISAQWVLSLNQFVRYATWIALLSVSALMISFSLAGSSLMIGKSLAVVKNSFANASVIWQMPDKETHLLPVLLTPLGKGRYSLANPNTDSVMLLDVRNPGDLQAIKEAGKTAQLGVVAHNARLAANKKPLDLTSMVPSDFVIDSQ